MTWNLVAPMSENTARSVIGYREFVALMAVMISLVALAIDTMLPALSQIGETFGVTDPNDNQLVVTTLFLGMAIGQLFHCPSAC